jgi:hypothetical protein
MGRLGIVAALLSGCTLKRYLPEPPALTEVQRLEFDVPTPSGVTYTGPARAAWPAPPVPVWGIGYDLDVVIATHHPSWDMHEIARIDGPDGPLWLAKDARAGSLDQTLVADVPDAYALVPEIPVERRSGEVRLLDRSVEGRLDLDVFYENVDGEPVRVSYRGPVPHTALRQRNGSTMGHSRGSLVAALDLPLRDLGSDAFVNINGKKQRIRRILGLVPFRMALVQTQAGLATGDWSITPSPPAFPDAPVTEVTTHHTLPGGAADQVWQVAWTDGGAELVQRHPLRTIRYRFTGSESLEWSGAEITQFGRDVPVLTVAISPALPDLRRPFTGTAESRFVLDVNGQRGHAVGRIRATSTPDGARVEVTPEAPWWVADRPLDGAVRFGPTGATLEMRRAE